MELQNRDEHPEPKPSAGLFGIAHWACAGCCVHGCCVLVHVHVCVRAALYRASSARMCVLYVAAFGTNEESSIEG